jgi:hypothetical protein
MRAARALGRPTERQAREEDPSKRVVTLTITDDGRMLDEDGTEIWRR